MNVALQNNLTVVAPVISGFSSKKIETLCNRGEVEGAQWAPGHSRTQYSETQHHWWSFDTAVYSCSAVRDNGRALYKGEMRTK